MKVVVVHDYVTQRGGAERVVLDMLRAFPGSRLVTSCFRASATFPGFAEHDVETLWIDKVPAFRSDPRLALPFLGGAFRRHVVTDADLVLCSSSGWSHQVSSTAPKVVYCHNPARWLHQRDDYLVTLPRAARRAFGLATRPLQRQDAEAARGATAYLANSSAVATRIGHAYGIEAQVVLPARGLEPDGPVEAVAGV